MNNAFVINPKIKEHQQIFLWYQSERTQELFAILTSMGVRISGFCMDVKKYPSFLGKKVHSVLSMIEEGDYALIINESSYGRVMERYGDLGLDEGRVFVWCDPKKETILL